MTPIRTILHPTDFSLHSGYAFRLACSLARDHGARVIVLHVMDWPGVVSSGGLTGPPRLEPVADVLALQEQLRQIKAPDPKVSIAHRWEEGTAAAGILQVARESQCDLIVLGTHGRTGLRRLLMGSVVEQVVRSAPCPVLTVKSEFTPAHPPPESGK